LPVLAVSACLLGRLCRFDGRLVPDARVLRLVARLRAEGHEVVEICPELLSGMGVPRPPVELRGGDGHAVLDGRARVCRTDDDVDVTDAFVDGARQADAIAGAADLAILKARSPSCGLGSTHVDGETRAGDGVLAALLLRRCVRIHRDEDPWPEALEGGS
jgi:uncharacterized protein YbbK (DUF523 family)